MKPIYSIFYRILLATFVFISCNDISQSQSPISPYTENNRYWQYKGEPVLLLGGSKGNYLFNLDSVEAHLDEMQKVGANYLRVTMGIWKGDHFEKQPFKVLEEGKCDLNAWNESFWNKVADVFKWANERDIIIQLELWDRFNYSRDTWKGCPYNPAVNINYTYAESSFDTLYPKHPFWDKQPFFHTIPGMPRYRPELDTVRFYQEKFIDKLLGLTFQYNNILYCINNETSTPTEWGLYWMAYIGQKAGQANKEVYVTDMFDEWFHPRSCEPCWQAFKEYDKYEYLDISQVNSRLKDQAHWDSLQWILKQREEYPVIRPANNTKVYGGPEYRDIFGSAKDGVEKFCRNIIGGCASARFHRPTSGHGLNQTAKNVIRAIRKVETYVKLWEVTPAMDLLGDRESDEAYLAAEEGAKYLLYFPSGGNVTLDLSEYEDLEFSGKWISVNTGGRGEEITVEGGASVSMQTPDDSGWFAVFIKK